MIPDDVLPKAVLAPGNPAAPKETKQGGALMMSLDLSVSMRQPRASLIPTVAAIRQQLLQLAYAGTHSPGRVMPGSALPGSAAEQAELPRAIQSP